MKTFFSLVLVIVLTGIFQQSLFAQSVQIPYQGYIADQTGKAYNGTFQFEFAVVIGTNTVSTWNSGTLSLPVQDGIYSVILGNTGQPALPASLFINNSDTKLRISFNDGIKGKETLAPDVQFLPVPYAVRAKYADTSFVQTALPPMDSLVLRDSRGVVRMVMNPNTGTFSMKNNDTTWYSISVESPPSKKFRYKYTTLEFKVESDGFTSITRTDNRTGKILEWESTGFDPATGKLVIYDKWYNYDGNGELEESGEHTSQNDEVTSYKKYDKDGNLTEEYTKKDGKSTTTYYKNGKVFRIIEIEETKEGSTYTSTKYDENGNPVSEYKQSNVGGRWTFENKDLKENKSSNGEPGKSVEKSGNSSTTTEAGKIDIKVGTNYFGMRIDPVTGIGGLWFTTPPSVDTPSISCGSGSITFEAPKVAAKTKELKVESPTSGGGTIIFIPETAGATPSTPRFDIERLTPPTPGTKQRSSFEWNPQNNFGITLFDLTSGDSTAITWDPIGKSVGCTHDMTVNGSVKGDTIKPRSKSAVTFSSGITVNGQSNFSTTIDVAGAAQIQQNGTFTGTAAVVQNATVQQQLRTNQILPIAPATTVTINGNLNVVGNLTKGGGNFKIDHPLDPYNKYLIHSFVESPDRTNIYSGNIITDASGLGIVTLPAYFEAANNDFRYQLTVIGADARAFVATEIDRNSFTIQTNVGNVKVSWQVTSTRTDAFAKSNQYEPEQEKELEMKGKLLYPIKE